VLSTGRPRNRGRGACDDRRSDCWLGLPDRGRADPHGLGFDICSGFDPPFSAPAPATVLASLASLIAPSLCSGKKEKPRPGETGALRTEGGGGRRGCLQSSTLLMSNSKLVQQAARFFDAAARILAHGIFRGSLARSTSEARRGARPRNPAGLDGPSETQHNDSHRQHAARRASRAREHARDPPADARGRSRERPHCQVGTAA
jgi:hypothetical protein